MSRGALIFWGAMMLAVPAMFGLRMYQQKVAEQRAAAEAAVPVDVKPVAPLVGHKVSNFTLTDQTGKTFDSSSLQGQVWVASFFFTSCPGPCLRMNNAIRELQLEMPDPAVRFVSITVDPERDTTEALTKYAAHFGAEGDRWLFLTGTLDEIRDIAAKRFQVSVDRGTHSDRLMVVDRDGVIQGTYRGTDPTEVALLKRKLTELVGGPT